ncbi:MAG: Holliday junction resolvase RuvX [Blastopirellula sp.]|nr:MAG: Holliday junction resolvase RuvX [Blastopirellula sp.]
MSELPEQDSPQVIPTTGRVAGVDYGTVRIGVAITDPGRILASPFENYNRRTPVKDASYFQQLAEQERVALFVVGLPVHMSGDDSEKSLEARAFGVWLNQQTDVPVIFYDERFTSSMAKQMLQDANVSKKKRKKRLDMMAAQILLTSYLENPSRAVESSEKLED